MKESTVAAERAEESRGEYECTWCAVLLLCLLWLCFAVVVLYCELKYVANVAFCLVTVH
mgnify:CR=1 FL=1